MSATKEQLAAASDIDAHTLVLATAGSGKTKMLIDKVFNILKANTENTVLMVTFTNAAVNEMKQRLEARLSQGDFKRVHVSTFHKLFLMQARKSMKGTLLIGPSFYNFIERVVHNINAEELIKGINEDDEEYVVRLKKSDAVDVIANNYRGDELDNKAIEIIRDTYKEFKQSSALYDLDDAAERAIEGMSEGSISPFNYTHCLVDEFQDTDPQQTQWLKLHRDSGTIITAVGDDDQGIYLFRGAQTYKAMLDFKLDYNANIHMLSVCFRCRPEIMAAARNMVEFNADRVPKEMKSGKEAGGNVTIYSHVSHASQFKTFIDNYNAIGGEWAILSRTNSLLKEASEVLTAHGIEHTLSGEKSIFETPAGAFVVRLCALMYDHQKYGRFTSEILAYLKEPEDVIRVISKAIESKLDVGVELEANGINIDKTSFNHFYTNQHYFIDTADHSDVAKRVNSIINFLIKKRKNDCSIEQSLLTGLLEKEGTWQDRLSFYVSKLSDMKSETTLDKSIVSLFTFHAAKGLEWSNVAIFDVVEDSLPIKDAVSIEEERRLMFVGMTRAEENLFIHTYVIKDTENIFFIEGDDAAIFDENEDLNIESYNVEPTFLKLQSRFIREIVYKE